MTMRRADRRLSEADALRIIDAAYVLRIAFIDGGEPYLVPVNFTRVGTALFFHSAREGRKVRLAAGCPRVCWEAEGGSEVRIGSTPCDCSCRYESVIGWGRLTEVADRDQKIAALAALNEKFRAPPGPFPDAMLERTAVFKIEMESFSGKANKA